MMTKLKNALGFGLLLCTIASTFEANAQRNYCDEDRQGYNSQTRCERFHDQCSYDRRSGCYTPDREVSRCEPRRNEFDTERECLRQNRYCEYNSRSGCYEPAVEERRCNPRYNEYERESECRMDHSQGCEYRNDIKCYVPRKEPPPPPPPPVCPWQDDDGSYEGRGRRGFRSQEICEISEGRRPGVCEIRSDGCWHPRGR